LGESHHWGEDINDGVNEELRNGKYLKFTQQVVESYVDYQKGNKQQLDALKRLGRNTGNHQLYVEPRYKSTGRANSRTENKPQCTAYVHQFELDTISVCRYASSV